MPNQKGSLIDRLRSWSLFLKYKFKLAKKKKEEKKRQKQLNKRIQINATGKYYSKPKIFWLTILGLFIGIFENKSSKESKITRLEEKINLIETKVEVLSIEEKYELTNSIKSEIVGLKAQNQFNDEIKSRIEVCEKRLNNVIAKEKTGKNVRTVLPNKKLNESDIKTNISNPEKQYQEKIQLNSTKTKKGVYTPVLEVKVINKEIKDHDKKLKEINNKIKNTTEYNNLYELEFVIQQLKIRFNDLLNRYNRLKELPGFDNLKNVTDIKQIDIFDLRCNVKIINLKIKECNICLDNIEKRKKELLTKTEVKSNREKQPQSADTKKQELKKETNKEQKKEDKKIDQKILEINLANKIILDRLSSEKRNIIKFQRSISKMGLRKKKRSIFYYTKNIISSVVNLSLSLFPVSLFKNKFIGGLTSGIMINNSLRSIKRVLTPEVETVYILYSDFEKELNQTNDYLNNIHYICNDSLKQINDIKNTIYMQYGNDLEYSIILADYLKDLYNIESQILKEQQTIMELQEQVYIIKYKNKQKIKRK